MNKHTQATSNDMGTLADDARALLAAIFGACLCAGQAETLTQ